MKLLFSDASPYARKARLVAEAAGLAERIELVRVNTAPTKEDPAVLAINPLSKIPALVLDDGQALYDSRVIVEYLDSIGTTPVLPRPGDPARWETLRIAALADGLLDAALLLRYETFLRPEPLRWEDWCAGQQRKIERALDALEGEIEPIRIGAPLNAIATASALAYLDFRFGHIDWRSSQPQLAGFYADYAKRPEMARTAPA